MNYITHTRFRTRAICGDVNIPAKTPIEERGGMLYYNGRPLCAARSQNALDYFARNDDGRGMERGRLTKAIITRLKGDPREQEVQARWDKVWDDELCQKYKRPEHADHWLWNKDFYNAPIEDLQYICKLVGARKE